MHILRLCVTVCVCSMWISVCLGMCVLCFRLKCVVSAVELQQCPLLAQFLTAGLTATVQDPLHQLIHTRCLLITRTIQSHHLPLGLSRHAGVAVYKRLCGLRKSVGYTVAKALSQTRPVLDGLRDTTYMPNYLCDVLGFAPGTFIRKQGQPVDVRMGRC